MSRLRICIVGAGPRGLSVLERLCANARSRRAVTAVTVHVVDPDSPGPGRVWRTDQSRQLLMNTVSSQATLFTDESVDIDGPVERGPSLYEWAQSLRPGDCDEQTLAEVAQLGPDTYPSRALYGTYLTWVFQRVVRSAQPEVTIDVHRSRAIALDDVGVTQRVLLEDGTELGNLDAVVLCQGHLPVSRSAGELEFADFARDHGLNYLTPANPADLDLSVIKPSETVLIRGLGLNFFDHLALLTVGRGGRFERVDGRLVYQVSGQEPLLYAGSRRGVPYHARGRNEKGPYGRYFPRLLTPETIARLRAEGTGLDFRTDLWPLIATEVESVYYGTLLGHTSRPFVDAYLEAPDDEAKRALLDRYGIAEQDRWDWEQISRPYGDRTFAEPAEFRTWLLGYLADDLRAADAGNLSGPLKAALDAMRDLRNEIRLAVDHCGLDGDSHRDSLENWYNPLNAFLSIGPPATRIEEMIALIEAGVLELLGPDVTVAADTDEVAFVGQSRQIPGSRVHATTLIEARLPEPDLQRTADPLLRHLLATGQCRAHGIPTADGRGYQTRGLAVTERPCHLIDAAGRAHPRRFAYGVPTEAVHWVTAAGIRPGVNSVTLGDSDAIARAVLAPHTDSRAGYHEAAA